MGNEIALKLKSRVADMRAVEAVTDLLAGNPREFEYENNVAFKIGLFSQECKFSALYTQKPPVLSTGKIDWHHVSHIKIISIGNGNIYKR